MWKSALAGALALVAAGIVPASAGERAATTVSGLSNGAIESRIAQAKAALNLRPNQERHWPRVAAAVRAWAAQAQSGDDAGHEFLQHAKGRAADLAARALGAKRVIVAAAPLMRTLDADQKQTALMLVQALGFGHLAAAL